MITPRDQGGQVFAQLPWRQHVTDNWPGLVLKETPEGDYVIDEVLAELSPAGEGTRTTSACSIRIPWEVAADLAICLANHIGEDRMAARMRNWVEIEDIGREDRPAEDPV